MNNQSVRTSVPRANELPIKNLLKRLKKVGFKESFIRESVLPEWWDDELSRNPSGMAIAEISIARHLNVPIEAMRANDALLLPTFEGDYRLKKIKTTNVDDLLPAIGIAQSVAESLATCGMDLVEPTFADLSASEIRQQILQTRQSVDLKGLLAWAWAHGIIVAHIKLPTGIKKFTGIVLYVNTRPVILLGAAKDSPSWLAFHLAHELGHLLLAHVRPGHPILDIEMGFRASDFIDTPEQLKEEDAANSFAIEVLTGEPQLEFPAIYGLTAPKLATRARGLEQRKRVQAGTVALIYGHTANRMPVAQNALRELGLSSGGIEIITNFVAQFLPETLPESVVSVFRLIGIEQDRTRCLLPTY